MFGVGVAVLTITVAGGMGMISVTLGMNERLQPRPARVPCR